MLGAIYNIARRLKRSNKFPVIRTLLNSMYYDPRMVTINMNNFDFIEVDDCKFYVNDQIDSIQRVYSNPWFANIKPDDIAIDIGANIGAITIPLAKAVKKVYAIEPLFVKELQQNIALNKLGNIEVMECGIGQSKLQQHYEFSSKEGTAPSIPLELLLVKTGKVDFVKIDGEGCEWDIQPEQLKGIREIRIEFHMRRRYLKRDKQALDKWLKWLETENYSYTLKKGDNTSPCVPFAECLILNATRSGKWDLLDK